MKPTEHQLKTVERFRDHTSHGLWHGCGTGKTATVCFCYNDKSQIEQRELLTLILCPKNVIDNWPTEFAKAIGKREQTLILSGSNRHDDLKKALENKTHNIFITNFEALSMKKMLPLLLKIKWDLLVADEIHNFKGPKNVRTQTLHKIADNSKYRLGLTGSLVLNSYEDIWSPMRFLEPGYVGHNFYGWRKKHFYNANATKPWLSFPDYQPLPQSIPYFEKLKLISGSVVTLDDVADLPPLIRSVRYVDLHESIARHYREMEKNFITSFLSDDGADAVVSDLVLTQRLRMQQICNGILKGQSGDVTVLETDKNPLLMETLESIGVPQHKVVIWANWRPAIDKIKQICKAMDLYYCEVVGGQDQDERTLSVNRFVNENKYSVMVASQAAGGEGLNLQVANYAIYYSKDFNLKHDLQSEARIRRKGSEVHSKLVRIDFLTKGTIEEDIHEALANKYDMASFKTKLKGKYGKN